MKNLKTRKPFNIRLVELLVLLLVTVSGQYVAAADHVINVSEANCAVTAVAQSPNGCDDNQCAGDAACVCVDKKDSITWIVSQDKAPFKMKFSGKSPLAKNCGKNFHKSPVSCKVKEEVNSGDQYSYLIMFENCANGSDPKIIIK